MLQRSVQANTVQQGCNSRAQKSWMLVCCTLEAAQLASLTAGAWICTLTTHGTCLSPLHGGQGRSPSGANTTQCCASTTPRLPPSPLNLLAPYAAAVGPERGGLLLLLAPSGELLELLGSTVVAAKFPMYFNGTFLSMEYLSWMNPAATVTIAAVTSIRAASIVAVPAITTGFRRW